MLLIPKKSVRFVDIVTMLLEIVEECTMRYATAILIQPMIVLTTYHGTLDLSYVRHKLKGIVSFTLMKSSILRSLEKELVLLYSQFYLAQSLLRILNICS